LLRSARKSLSGRTQKPNRACRPDGGNLDLPRHTAQRGRSRDFETMNRDGAGVPLTRTGSRLPQLQGREVVGGGGGSEAKGSYRGAAAHHKSRTPHREDRTESLKVSPYLSMAPRVAPGQLRQATAREKTKRKNSRKKRDYSTAQGHDPT